MHKNNSEKFGSYGGRYVPETLLPALNELTKTYFKAKKQASFKKEFNHYLKSYAGRPTPLYFAKSLSKKLGAKIYLKREDLLHTGAHKINNCLGQILLARQMGKKRIIAETGAGQHGVAVATAAALFGLECVVYMGSVDVKRQALNVQRMKLLGTKVVPVTSGSQTLKDAINEALRDWVSNVETSYYLIGSVVGPHPYPLMVRDFQAVIGQEARKQIVKLEGRLPDYLVACVGGGSNAMGLFYPFLSDKKVKMIGVEAGGKGLKMGEHSRTLGLGKPGVLHGAYSYLLQDKEGQVVEAHSVSAGLDYPGVGPEHSFLKDIKRVKYVSVGDKQAVQTFSEFSKLEGIIPALESSHALAYLKKFCSGVGKGKIIVVNLSGRGDKDLGIVNEFLNS